MAIDQITTGIIKDDAVTGAKLENSPTIAANLSVAGTTALTGVATHTARSIHSAGITIADDGQIGSASDLDAIAIAANGNVTLSQDLTVTGDLTVSGDTTTINTATLEVEDKHIEIAKVGSPSDTTADGGGIIIKGASDKTMLWANSTDSFDFNQHVFPSADNTKDLGSASKRWRNIYTGDLHLANDRGNWTVIEEENYLTLRNNKTDKVYKLVMEEIV